MSEAHACVDCGRPTLDEELRWALHDLYVIEAECGRLRSKAARWRHLLLRVIEITTAELVECITEIEGALDADPPREESGSVSGGIAAGDRDCHLWAAQMEAGGFASEYIPATASTGVVRSGETGA